MDLNPGRLIEYAIMFIVLFYTLSILFLAVKNRWRFHSRKEKYWEPTVSVIIPAYNEGKTIGKTVNSLLNVDYPEDKIEVIVVDDGSTDNTAEVVNEISKNHKRVVLLKKKNEGNAAYAKNYGLKHAKGEIIITLDADSWVTKQSIRKLLSNFDEDVAAVTAAVKVQSKKKMSFLEKLQKIEYLFTLFNRRIFSFINGVWVTPGPLSAFRREIFGEIGDFDTSTIMEDQEMALRIQSANYRIASCTDAVVFTVVPDNLRDLYKQRLRWNRGGIRNILRYRFLAKASYGDFGAFIMPISIASIFLSIAILMIVAGSFAKFLTPSGSSFSDILLSIEPVHVLSAIVIALTALWTWFALKELGTEANPLYLIIYILIYCYMVSFFLIAAILKEVSGRTTKW